MENGYVHLFLLVFVTVSWWSSNEASSFTVRPQLDPLRVERIELKVFVPLHALAFSGFKVPAHTISLRLHSSFITFIPDAGSRPLRFIRFNKSLWIIDYLVFLRTFERQMTQWYDFRGKWLTEVMTKCPCRLHDAMIASSKEPIIQSHTACDATPTDK